MNPGKNEVDQRLYEIGRSYSDAHYRPESRLVGTSVRGGCAYALMLVASGDQADCQEAELVVPEVIAYHSMIKFFSVASGRDFACP